MYSVFNSLLKTTSKDDINELEETQEKLNKKMPLDVKFNKDYLWQIYYSDIEDKYFMMVPINETECEALFFLLKQQLSGKNRKIYVPICHLGYSDKFLMEQEIKDIENALWLFTGNWAAIYEVYDKSDNMTLVIRGKTKIFENVTSDYKIELKTKEEAREFYNLVQALFLLQTHYPKNYNFKVKVLETGEIQFAQNDISIDAEHMLDFIQEQYSNNILDITKLREEQINLNNKLKNLKKLEVKKQEEFLEKERKIATFLQCKKSFFGKLKYFLVYKKSKPDINLEETKEKIEEPTIKYFEKTKTKKIYSMQELMERTKELEKETTTTNSLKLDIDGIQRKLDMLTNKIKNVDFYTVDSFGCKKCKTSLECLSYYDLKDILETEIIEDKFEYQHIIVDEGQDFGRERADDSKILELFYDYGENPVDDKKNTSFFIFYDKNQLVNSKKLPTYIQNVDSKLTLYKNCRNTKNIAATAYSLIELKPVLYDKAYALGGLASGEHGIGLSKQKYLLKASKPENIALMKRVKAAFDEKNILNAGISYNV